MITNQNLKRLQPPSGGVFFSLGIEMRLLTLKAQKQQNGDVHLFNQSGQRVACYDRFRSNKPDRRYKFVMHNCFRYKLEWID